MHVAVFGGSGFVGRYLVDALIEAGHEPSLLVRPSSEDKVLRAEECRLISGDLGNRDAVETAVSGCDAVIYNVGILREDAARGITFEAMQYDGVVQVCNAAMAQGISRFLLMSANGVRRPGTPYQETKARAEEHVKSAGFAATVFRPSVIFGDPRGAMEIASQLHRDMIRPPLPAAGFFSGWRPSRGQVVMSPVHVEDVAQAFVAALGNPATVGETYRLGGPETLTWVEMLQRIAAAVGKRKSIVPVPLAAMGLLATLLDGLPFFPVTRDQLKMLAQGNSADPNALEALLGRPATAFARDNLSYLAAAG
ncbi:MAG: hypothetical protein ACI9DC_003339 [Gammaproteobacteria bacterium]|jgi:uncharacterized protein YbjT (DUF2867 family)